MFLFYVAVLSLSVTCSWSLCQNDVPTFTLMPFESGSGRQCESFTIGSSVTFIYKLRLSPCLLPYQFGFSINKDVVALLGIDANSQIIVRRENTTYYSRIAPRAVLISSSSSEISVIATLTLSHLNLTEDGLVFSDPAFGGKVLYESDPLSVRACSASTAKVQATCAGGDLCIFNSSAELTCYNDSSRSVSTPSISTRCGECAEFDDTINCLQDFAGCAESCYIPIIVVIIWVILIVILSWWFYQIYDDGFPPWARNIFVLAVFVIIFPIGLGFMVWLLCLRKDHKGDSAPSSPGVQPSMDRNNQLNKPTTV